MRLKVWFVAGALCAVIAAPPQGASAGYMMSVTSGGQASANVAPGDSFTLDVSIAADGSEQHNSSIFRVVFSMGGLRYLGYEWNSPYLNGTIDDDSKPLDSALPVVLDDLTLAGVGYPAGVVDVELSNVLPIGPNFGSGIVASLVLQVPEDYDGPDEVLISLAPDQIALNGDEISTRTGEAFTLVVPSGGGAAFLMAAVCGASGRRRRGPAQGQGWKRGTSREE